MFRTGNPTFIQKLYAKCDGRLHTHARCLLGDSDDADDAVAETWRLAWDRRTQARGVASVQHWLLSICDAVCVNKLLRQHQEEVVLRDAAMDRDPVATDDVIIEASALQVQAAVDHVTRALADLPRRQADVVTFRYLMNKSTTETAETMQCTPATVRANLHKALRSLNGNAGKALSVLLAARAALVSGISEDVVEIPVIRDGDGRSRSRTISP
jgi:RNA polymerase sigma-70 factor (ECF subfamily)